MHGVTSNPTIFQGAIADGDAYDEQLREVLQTESEPKEIFLALAVRDIQAACDELRPVHDEGSGRDGWVSLEVDPNLAHDTDGTIEEATRLHGLVDRPNLLVKIPATLEGLPAIEESIARGIPINVTLIFSLERHRAVAEAYVRGLQRLVESGGDPTRIASVASFFVSRVDTEVDKRLDEIGGHDELKGKLAIANAKLAYQTYKEIFSGSDWEALAAKGATAQRCLWASTSTKNPEYRDVLYVEELIGPETVNTMPRETIEAFQDHGEAENRLEQDVEGARKLLEDLKAAGVDYDDVVAVLEQRGRREVRQVLPGALLRRRVQARPAGGGMSELGQQLRVDSVRSSAAANSGHPTSSMSAADLMAVLMEKHLRLDYSDPENPNNDHLIFSKGHASPLFFSMLKAGGAVTDKELLTFRKFGSKLEGHPVPNMPFVDVATGSLGQGLPIAVGVALAAKKLDRLPYRVWCLCGDSEMAEGSMWEAFEHAAFNGLDNLTAIIDVNRLGQTRETMVGWDLDRYVKRAEAFGWNAIAIDGHDDDQIDAAYTEARETTGRPTVIVARTKKGKGVKAVEDLPGKHGKPIEDPEAAIEELGGERDLTVDVAKPDSGGREPHRFDVPGGELPIVGPRRGGRDARGLRQVDHRARLDRRRRRGARRRGLELHARGDVPRGPRGPLLRDVHRRAADGRGRGRHAGASTGSRSPRRSRRSSRAPTTSSAWRRSRARTCACRARTPASRSARTARRRWRWRTSRRSARSTAAACCTPPTPTRRRSWWPRWPSATASPTCAPCAGRRRCARRPTSRSRSAAAGSPTRATTSRSSPAASSSTRRSRRPSSSRARA